MSDEQTLRYSIVLDLGSESSASWLSSMSPVARPRKSSGTRRFMWIQAHPLFGRGIPVIASTSGRSLSGISPSGPARSLLILSVSRHRQQTLESLARFSSPHRLHRTSSGTSQQRTQRGRASVSSPGRMPS
ncbi:hypothetical protein [Streptomyces sp. NPDC014685]|uniref:hypothetical protein n=1 Tax=Streptomyces sp. NPDC014685 TaxID=3364881 RepID=UPI0036FC5B92